MAITKRSLSVPTLAQLQSRLEFVFKEVVDSGTIGSKVDSSRLTNLRISSFPFCARNWFFNLPVSSGRLKRDKAMDSFFFNMGHAVHHVMQTALESVADTIGEKGISFVRDWKCDACDFNHVYVTKPDVCKKCGTKKLIGQETTVTYGRNTVGHIDDTIQLGKYQITSDYKTCSASKIKTGKLPNPGNVSQIETYAAIKVSEGHPVIGWCLIYICRDNPNNRKVIVHLFKPGEVDKILARVDQFERDYRSARRAFKSLDIKEAKCLQAKCTKDNFDDYCDYARVCKGGVSSINKHYQEVIVKLEKRRAKADGQV